MPIDRNDLARACRAFGTCLWLPPTLDGPKLLWALSGCESSFGENTNPRHEAYYHELALKGTNAQLVALTTKFGCDAHSSFGPWQELLVNCSESMTPDQFTNVRRAAMESVGFINKRILKAEKATTLEEIAEAYNSGKWQWMTVPPGAERYAAQCREYYDTVPLPAAVV